MDWLNNQLHKLAEWITNFKPGKFWWLFTMGTFFLASVIAKGVYFILDAFDKANVLPNDPGMLIVSLFLALWIIVMIMTATFIFTFGGRLIRFDLPTDRLDSLKESGLISKTDERIWLIGLSLHPFTSEGWIKILENKIKKGVSVKLLIFDPNTEFAKNRSSSLRRDERALADDIKEAIEAFTGFKKTLSINYRAFADKFEVHLYKGNACMSAFILDDEARVGLYLNGDTGLSAPELRVVNKGSQIDFFSKIERHFETIWGESSDAIQMDNANEE